MIDESAAVPNLENWWCGTEAGTSKKWQNEGTMNLFDPAPVVRAHEGISLGALAVQINAAHSQGEQATRRGLEHFRQVGEMLIAAKERCGHGEWLPWLEANVKFSHMHATRYMRLAKCNVTLDLADEWRAILGNDDPEPEIVLPKPTEDPHRWTNLSNDVQEQVKSGDLSVGQANSLFDQQHPESSADDATAEPEWTADESDRRATVEGGDTVIANFKNDHRLIAWAESQGVFVRVDRQSDWGNPYLLGEDGDRDQVCDSFAIYFAHKKGLHRRVAELRGKVLGCWCHPERCHACILAEFANGGAL